MPRVRLLLISAQCTWNELKQAENCWTVLPASQDQKIIQYSAPKAPLLQFKR